jgi:alanyl-tRNA synthetase
LIASARSASARSSSATTAIASATRASLRASDTEIILDRTPFYPEGGGPRGDRGFIASTEDEGFEFQVEDTQRHGDLIVHQGHYLSGGPQDASGLVEATVDLGTRDAIRRNHTGTHILHWALREVLGERVAQQGSDIKPELFTFDFTWSQAISEDQLAEIERLVNEKIISNDLVDTAVMSLEDARAKGATALFGEKYGEEVRVLSIGDGYSTELCGGIHCHRSGDVGSLKILRESSVSAGVRRIEAVTGSYAVENAITEHAILSRLARDFKAPASELESRVAELKAQVKELRKQLEKADAAAVSPKEMLSRAEDLGAFRLLVSAFPGDSAALRKVGDAVKSQEKPTLALLMATNDKGVGVLCAMTKDLVSQGWNANDVLRAATSVLGGGGGGRPDFAEGRGQKADQVEAASEAVKAFVKGKL